MEPQPDRQRRFVTTHALKRCIDVLGQALRDLPDAVREDGLAEKLRRVMRAASEELRGKDQDK